MVTNGELRTGVKGSQGQRLTTPATANNGQRVDIPDWASAVDIISGSTALKIRRQNADYDDLDADDIAIGTHFDDLPPNSAARIDWKPSAVRSRPGAVFVASNPGAAAFSITVVE